MKKTALLIALLASFSAGAQVTLTGTSYTQNFNGIGSGLPLGWTVYTGASASSAGSLATFSSSVNFGIFADTITCISDVYGGGFKNYPSANAVSKAATCANQKTITDRALGVRQVSSTNATFPNSDPGAAIVFKIANTTGISNLQLSFKLQSLDTTSPRQTNWTVDYATGSAPTSFTAIPTTPSSLSTGNLVFSNTTVTANFGTALNNISSNVWIRIVALSPSTGTGNRPSTAIDDFTLTYVNTVGVSEISAQPELGLTVAGSANTNNVNFLYSAEEAGNYNFTIHDLSGRVVYTETINATASIAQHFSVNGMNLASGMYIAKMSNAKSSAVAKVIVQ